MPEHTTHYEMLLAWQRDINANEKKSLDKGPNK